MARWLKYIVVVQLRGPEFRSKHPCKKAGHLKTPVTAAPTPTHINKQNSRLIAYDMQISGLYLQHHRKGGGGEREKRKQGEKGDGLSETIQTEYVKMLSDVV